MSRNSYPFIRMWLATMQGLESGIPPSLLSTIAPMSGAYGYSKSAPLTREERSIGDYSLTRYSESASKSFCFNSAHRSTYELLKSLPLPSRMIKILPDLPTYRYSRIELINCLPHELSNPIDPRVFESLAAAEAECARVLDFRECLRVEEITTEMQMDMGQLFRVNPDAYSAYQEHLGDVRVLITRACRSLTYIQQACSQHGLELDLESIGRQCVENRPFNHPYCMIACYLKSDAWEMFNDYSAFIDKDQNDGAGAAVEDSDTESSSDTDSLSEEEGEDAEGGFPFIVPQGPEHRVPMDIHRDHARRNMTVDISEPTLMPYDNPNDTELPLKNGDRRMWGGAHVD